MKQKFSKKHGYLFAVLLFVVIVTAVGCGSSSKGNEPDQEKYIEKFEECFNRAVIVAVENQEFSTAAGDAFNKSLNEQKDIHGNYCDDAFKAIAVYAEENKKELDIIQNKIDSLEIQFSLLGDTPAGFEDIHNDLTDFISKISTHGAQVRNCILKTADSAGSPSNVVRIYPDVADRLYIDLESKFKTIESKLEKIKKGK